jgi:signal transduction histidine kinase
VRIEVTDHGPGIAPEHHPKIFEKFGQLDTDVRQSIPSSGLGLYFCKLAVEAHGGRIGVDSAVGKGSTFWFELPVRGPAT